MRLTQDQRTAIVETARQHFGSDCRVTLFGSRVDDKLLGGDIEFKKQIGDRQVDVVPRASDGTPTAIHTVAEKDGVVLT